MDYRVGLPETGARRRWRLDRAGDFVAPRGLCQLQDDFSVANASGATVRADINAQLQSLATLSSGATAPATTYANQLWIDTTATLAKKRNNANSAWQTFASRDFDVWLLGDGTVGAPAYSFSGDTDCGMYRIGANNIGWAVGGVKVFEISGTTLTAHTLTVSTGALTAVNGTFSGTLGVTGMTYINDTSNVNMTTGLTINQGAADNEILAFKSSDVAHGLTSVAETDTYGTFGKADPATGILHIIGLRASGDTALITEGIVSSAGGSTTKSTAGVGVIDVRAYKGDGATGKTAIGANENIAAFRAGTTTRFILDADGDSHQDVGTAWTNFDAHDDLQVMDALALTLNRGDVLRTTFIDSLEESREILERIPGKKIVTFNEDGHHFANMSRVTMLHHGAIRQIGRAIQQLTAENTALTNKLAALESRQ